MNDQTKSNQKPESSQILSKVFNQSKSLINSICQRFKTVNIFYRNQAIQILKNQMSKQRPSGQTKDGNNISSKLLGANISDINIEKFRDLTTYQKDAYHLNGKITISMLKTITNKFSPEVIFTINLPNQAIGSLQCLTECINLMVINLSRNNIDDLSPLKVITTLKIANLSQNNIKSLQGLRNSKQLTNLHLEGNLIKSIDNLQPLKQCKQLRNLYLKTLAGNNSSPICELKNYRENVLEMISSLKRLDGVPRNVQFFNGSEIQLGKKKQLKMELKLTPFYTNKFPSVGQYQVPVYSGQNELKKSLANCKAQIQDLQLRARALLTK